MSPIIGDRKDLELYSEQFICMLYQLTNRTTFRSRNADEVFKKLKLGGFHDITGTTDEIVQHLVEGGRIKFGSGRQVIFTQDGKNSCDSHCGPHHQRFNSGGYYD
jgi:hypothetical protein